MVASSTSTPAMPPSRAGTSASTQGQARVAPPSAVRIRVVATAGGPIISSQASWRPRTSARAAPGVSRVSQRAVPSAP